MASDITTIDETADQDIATNDGDTLVADAGAVNLDNSSFIEPPAQRDPLPSPRFRLPPAPRRVQSALAPASRRSARFLDFLAVEPRRRLRASAILALGVNVLLFTFLAVFGRFQIWIPSTPGDFISIVMVDLPPAPEPPELRDPEILPEPVIEIEPELEPEPEPEPEPVASAPEPAEAAPEPEPQPDPEPLPPEPEPEPEPELEPEPMQPEVEPALALDTWDDTMFAPPADTEDAPFIPEPEIVDVEEVAPIDLGEEPAPAPREEIVQAPAEEAPPLVDQVAEPEPGLEVTADRTDEPSGAETLAEAEEEDEIEGEKAAPAIAETLPQEPAISGDDMFDEAPALGTPRFALPTVNLPEGNAAITPGSSGVVAIFCDEQFDDKEKAAECAGRTEIRSGWRPGASGEDWSEAARLLKQERTAGRDGVDPSAIYGTAAGRSIEDARRAQDLTDFRRSQDGLNDPAGVAAGNLNRTLGQPDIGPDAFEPSWTLREDPDLTQKDLDELEDQLREAEENR